MRTGKLSTAFGAKNQRAASVSFAANGDLIISTDSGFNVLDAVSGASNGVFSEESDTRIGNIAVIGGVRRSLETTADGSIAIRELGTRNLWRNISGHFASVTIGPDRKTAVALGKNGLLNVVDLESGKVIRSFGVGTHGQRM